MRTLLLKYCKYCGEAFETYNSEQVFCSNLCANKFNYSLLKVEKVCPVCHNKFMGGVSSKYCSKKCYYEATEYKKKSQDKICPVCGKSFKGNNRKKYCSKICAKSVVYYKKKPALKNETLCWDCKNACGGCSWSRTFTPVKGWVAEPTKLKGSHEYSAIIDSYKIFECPEFERG